MIICFFLKKIPRRVKIYEMDANLLANISSDLKVGRYYPFLKIFKKEKVDWVAKFDIVVTNYIF